MKNKNLKKLVAQTIKSAVLVFATTSLTYAQPEVTASKLSVQCFNDYTEVEWLLDVQENVEYFRLTRSYNTIDWSTIDIIEAEPGSTNVFYSYIDYTPYAIGGGSGYVYYRLYAFDNEGNSIELKSLEMSCLRGEDEPIIVSPNPTTGPIVISGPIKGTVDEGYSVTNRMGQVIKKGVVPQEGAIDLNDVEEGMYILHIGNKKEPVRVWKK